MFDGVHLGHQQVIRQTIEDARQHEGVAVAITFDCHPNAVVAPGRHPPLIYSLPQKLRVIESLGIDTTWLIHFDKAFSEIPGEAFIRGLARDFGAVHSLCVGSAFTFGHKRSGSIALLKRLGQELAFIVHGLASVSLDGKVVSSTRIREAIRAGNFDAAGQMLGRPYAICGVVEQGDRIGHELGFPTANLSVQNLVLPPNGVYAARATVAGKVYSVALNIGLRPTVASTKPQLRVEAHLLDFSGELYGTELEVEIISKLRDERRFSSSSDLREQIGRDVATVRELV
jgi:riboflavin kinase/FMN adenylyltransferase